MSEMIWHPASELPPMHEESWGDDGELITCVLSDWILVYVGTCDGVYEPPIRAARCAKCRDRFQWEDGGGLIWGGTHWAYPPEGPEKKKGEEK